MGSRPPSEPCKGNRKIEEEGQNGAACVRLTLPRPQEGWCRTLQRHILKQQ